MAIAASQVSVLLVSQIARLAMVHAAKVVAAVTKAATHALAMPTEIVVRSATGNLPAIVLLQ
jgi:hypothetical protein